MSTTSATTAHLQPAQPTDRTITTPQATDPLPPHRRAPVRTTGALPDADLLALEIRLARQGCEDASLTDLVRVLLGEDAAAIVATTFGLRPLLDRGAGRDMALDTRVRLAALTEILRRLSQERVTGGTITGPHDVATRFAHLVTLDHEQLHVLALDSRHRVLRSRCLAVGTTASVTAEIGEILRFVLEARGVAFVLVHNHPSGAAEPSESDRAMTEDCFTAARRLGLRPLDHVIVGAGQAWSFAHQGLVHL